MNSLQTDHKSVGENLMKTIRLQKLEPITIARDVPAPGAVMALVWPDTGLEPSVGMERNLVFNGILVTASVAMVMDLDEGHTGVLMRMLQVSH